MKTSTPNPNIGVVAPIRGRRPQAEASCHPAMRAAVIAAIAATLLLGVLTLSNTLAGWLAVERGVKIAYLSPL